MKIEIRNLKTWQSREGGGWQATFYIDGEKAFMATNEGRGGAIDFDSFDADLMEAFKAHVMSLPVDSFAIDGDEEFAASLDLDGRMEIYACTLIDRHEEDKRLKRLCRTQIVIRKKAEPDKLFTIPRPFSPDVVDQLKAKYGNELLEIVNLRFQ